MRNPPFFPKVPVCSHFLTIDCITFDNTLFLQLPRLILLVEKFFAKYPRSAKADRQGRYELRRTAGAGGIIHTQQRRTDRVDMHVPLRLRTKIIFFA